VPNLTDRKVKEWLTLSIIVLIIVTHIPDSLNRRLIDDMDVDEQRIWCLVQYSN